MNVKVHKHGFRGIPKARVVVSQGVNPNGAAEVTAFVSAVDAHDFPEVVASLRLTPDEARNLAMRLVDAATRAEDLT